jgi:hypothetical protein
VASEHVKLIPHQIKVVPDDFCNIFPRGNTKHALLRDEESMLGEHLTPLLDLVRSPDCLLNHPWPKTGVTRELNNMSMDMALILSCMI